MFTAHLSLTGCVPIHMPEDGGTAQFFWSIEGAWGLVRFTDGVMTLAVLYGELRLRSPGICGKVVEFGEERVMEAGDEIVI